MIEVHQLSVRQNRKPLFHPISFIAKPHDIVVVVGPNGCGKTTLLRTLATMHGKDTGTILFNKQTIEEHLDAYRQNIHFLGHHNGLYRSLTVLENIHLMGYQHQSNVAINELTTKLNQFHLQDCQHRRVSQLSAGQRRRLALIRCMLFHKPIWILDEPFTSIDVATTITLQKIFQNYVTLGGTIVLSAHQKASLPQASIVELEPC